MTLYQQRKVAVIPTLTNPSVSSALPIAEPTSPFPHQVGPGSLRTVTGVDAEEAARIAGDNALQGQIITLTGQVNALNADLGQEILARTDADTVLQNNITNEVGARIDGDDALAIEITNETNARVQGDTVAHWASLDFRNLPTVDPGNGQPWLDGGLIRITVP